MCRRALAAGGDVVAWDLDEAALGALAEEQRSARGTLQTAVVNVMDREQVDRAALEAGAIDILVNNAGIVSGQRLLEESVAGVERVMGVNALSLFWTTRAFLPAMIARDSGHIVTMASAAGLVPLKGGVSYTASKHAAVGFHDALRQELRDEAPHVHTTLVTPFYVNTGMFAGSKSRFDFLLPVVEVDDAVTRIMNAVSKDRDRVIMPGTAALSYLYRAFPTRVSDFFLDHLGISNSMDHFSGPGIPVGAFEQAK
jgi:all-trans-retinol dehydrogenase (NAD+)